MSNLNDEHAVADEQALRWLTKKQNTLSAKEQKQFAAWWLQGDNASRYRQMEQLWNTVGQLPQESVAQLRRTLPDRRTNITRPAFWRWPQMTAVLLLLVLVWPVSQWLAPPLMTTTAQTGRGETRQLSLPDGTSLTLDADTRVQVRYYAHRREVTLSQGQAYFQVAHLADRPFVVLSGPSRVTVLGTEFSVRYIPHSMSGEGVAVAVSSGVVRVGAREWLQDSLWRALASLQSAPDERHLLVLRSSQRAVSDATGDLTRQSSVALNTIADWRQSRVIFDNTPLNLALAEFARYGEMPYQLASGDIAALRISGSFDVHRIDSFAHMLPKVLPVKISTQSGQAQILKR